MSNLEYCFACDGMGSLDGQRCDRCGGTGVLVHLDEEGDQ